MRRPLVRPAALVVPAALAALALLPACSTVEPSAATVNGTRIDRSDLEDALDGYVDNERFRTTQEAQGGRVVGDGPETVSADFARSVLAQAIVAEVAGQELRRRGGEVTPGAREQARLLLEQDYTPEVFGAFSEGFRSARVEETARLLQLGLDASGSEGLDEAQLRREYDADPQRFAERCVSHVLLEDEATAEAVRAELDGGADFATVAASRSTDPSAAQNGGALGCFGAEEARLDPTFLAAALEAEPGEVTEPVQTQFGWHLILVTEVRDRPYEEVGPLLRQAVLGEVTGPLQQAMDEALARADVDVSSRYGHWDPTAARVAAGSAPDDPAPSPSTTSAPAAPPAG